MRLQSSGVATLSFMESMRLNHVSIVLQTSPASIWHTIRCSTLSLWACLLFTAAVPLVSRIIHAGDLPRLFDAFARIIRKPIVPIIRPNAVQAADWVFRTVAWLLEQGEDGEGTQSWPAGAASSYLPSVSGATETGEMIGGTEDVVRVGFDEAEYVQAVIRCTQAVVNGLIDRTESLTESAHSYLDTLHRFGGRSGLELQQMTLLRIVTKPLQKQNSSTVQCRRLLAWIYHWLPRLPEQAFSRAASLHALSAMTMALQHRDPAVRNVEGPVSVIPFLGWL